MIPEGIPDRKRDLIKFANDSVEQCRTGQGMRAAYYRTMNSLAETGRYDGTKSLLNMLHKALDETAAHLFSPVELKFTMDFEKPYDKIVYARAAEAAKGVTRIWERNSIDITFARGVFEGLKYGGSILKQFVTYEGSDEHPVYNDKLVMPWNFGVWREDENKIDRQEILCETTTLSGPEVWQRIWRMPGADKLYTRIMAHARAGQATGEPLSFSHQVLSTSQINTGIQ